MLLILMNRNLVEEPQISSFTLALSCMSINTCECRAKRLDVELYAHI